MGIRDDLFNITASLKKFEVLYEVSGRYKTESSRFVVTELEYLFSLCRSVFDLLQEMICKQWEIVELVDPDIKKRSLPKTFSKIVLNSGTLRTAQQISDKFSLPIELAGYYERHGTFFQLLRTFRGQIYLGDDRFVERLQRQLPKDGALREVARLQHRPKPEPLSYYTSFDSQHRGWRKPIYPVITR